MFKINKEHLALSVRGKRPCTFISRPRCESSDIQVDYFEAIYEMQQETHKPSASSLCDLTTSFNSSSRVKFRGMRSCFRVPREHENVSGVQRIKCLLDFMIHR